jgi:hypothetical protein
MFEVIARIDDFGKLAWIGLMVLGFIFYWPIGLAILAFIIWSGRMSCGWHRGDINQWRERTIERVNRAAEHWERKRARWEERRREWGGRHGGGLRETGNRAFDEYRAEALRRLEEEANEFRTFLDRLRMARDRAEFDEYIKERRNRSAGPGPSGSAEPQTP